MNQLLISFLAFVAAFEPQAVSDPTAADPTAADPIENPVAAPARDAEPAASEILPPPVEGLPSEVAAEADPVPPVVLTPASEPVTPQEEGEVKTAFADLSDAALFARAAEAVEGIDTMTARFNQVSPSGHETTGTLSLDRPGRLRFDYDQPSDQLVVATGGVVYVHDAALETTDSYPVSKTPLRFLLSRRIDTEQADLREVYRSEEGAAILLAATDEDVSGELALVFSAPDFQLKEWVVIEPNGASTRVTLSEIKMGERLPGRLFRVPDSGGAFLRDR
ncbi:MAG: outer-membrane lipoprotein carrier protein LolA [Parvularcula sp.]